MMSSSNRVIAAMVAAAVLVVAFWVLVLSPVRQEADELGATANELKSTLAQHQQEAAVALAAKKSFSEDYEQLVVLGKAVPGDDDTASLLVALNSIADRAHVRFQEIGLEAGEGEAAPVAAPAVGGLEAAAPTEVAASLMPLGATIGPAGLAVMPYSLKFTGDFSHVSDFIKGLDKLVKTTNSGVAVDGRLITVDGFSLASAQGQSFPHLEANFAVTTFLTPPSQGVTAGATPVEPLATGTPASMTTGATP
jgi:Tfp pilus assembly protein PilO